MKPILSSLVLWLSVALPAVNAADDVYYDLALTMLDGVAPLKTNDNSPEWRAVSLRGPRSHAVLDGEGEVYLDANVLPWEPMSRFVDSGRLTIRAPRGASVSGRLVVTAPEPVVLQFKASAADSRPDSKDKFFEAKENHYVRLWNQNIPGGAWFRHQANEAAKNRGAPTNNTANRPQALNQRRQADSNLESTYDLFTGGRALSENLQLDRVLRLTITNQESVALTNLAGITVAEMNWKELLRDARPDPDPLAAFTPADQHAVFFPSFQAMTLMIDEADANGTPVLQLLEPRSEDANTRTRYQNQLCLGLSELSRLLGPQVINSVAFTGSDPYLRVGTDVAVLFEARNPELLKPYILARQKAAQTSDADVKAVQGDIGGVAFTGVLSPDRSISSYLATVSNVVIVSNSRQQLEYLIRVAKGRSAALSSQDEYLYFRQRYPRSDKSETAFVMLTDATIRRWCGPKWRIADSRRTRAAAVLSELQASHLSELASGKAADSILTAGYAVPDAREFRLTRSGATCSGYGSLNFMTPIIELPIERVTRAEADAYDRWRNGYQDNWSQFFDPIAIRFSVAKDRLGAELSVMPLIAGSDYREFVAFSSGAEIAPAACDPHTNTLFHLVLAINTQSDPVREAGNFLRSMAPGLQANAFSWMGQSFALYMDEDPFWDRLRQATNAIRFLQDNYLDLPVALHVEVKNQLGLAAFLTAVRAYIDQTAPGMSVWQNLDYKGKPFVKITPSSPHSQSEKNLAVYYAATSRALVITLNKPLLERALDRQIADENPAGGGRKPAEPWPGKSLSAVAGLRFFDVLRLFTRESYESHLQSAAWNNLPALNEWKRLFPDKDPVKLHEQLWGTRLLCPGGGSYLWNQKWRTMESTVFGHPGEPKATSSDPLAEFLSAQAGITFENRGLSGKAQLNRKPKN